MTTTMPTTTIPGLDKPVARLAQGTVMIGSQDEAGSFELLDAIFAQGGNFFDTAHVYGGGDKERTFGRWVHSRGIRDRIVLMDKGAHHNADRQRVTPFDIAADLHDSLARLGFDYIDLYVLHRDDPAVPVGPIVEALNEQQVAGRIRAFGGSNWTHERIAEANRYAADHGLTGFAVASPNFSLARQVNEPWPNCVSISGPDGEAARRWYAKQEVTVVPWSSLAGGWFSGRMKPDNLDTFTEGLDALCVKCYASDDNFERLSRAQALADELGLTVAQVALAYVASQPFDVIPLVGARRPEEFADSLAALSVRLTDRQIAWLELRSDHP